VVESGLEIRVEVAGSKEKWESWGKLTSALLIENLVSKSVKTFIGWGSRTYSLLWSIVGFCDLGKFCGSGDEIDTPIVHEKLPRLFCRSPNIACLGEGLEAMTLTYFAVFEIP
jgi:hypothetical protein